MVLGSWLRPGIVSTAVPSSNDTHPGEDEQLITSGKDVLASTSSLPVARKNQCECNGSNVGLLKTLERKPGQRSMGAGQEKRRTI
jgi:hypothetical protein